MSNQTEAFRVEQYEGDVPDLTEQVTGLIGVQSASGPHKYEVSSSVDLEIEYDPIETDRTRIALDIEQFDSVAGEVTLA